MRFGSSSSALSVLALAIPFLPTSLSQVTVYTGINGEAASGTEANPTATDGGPGGFVTNLPAYDTLRLTGPAPIQPPLTGYSIGIPSPDLLSPDRPLSRPIRGNLLGFSVELSVADQVLGTTGQVLKPQFLNYLANIQQRAGVGPQVRVGGNSQEGSSIFVEGTSNGRLIEKIKVSDYAVSSELYSPARRSADRDRRQHPSSTMPPLSLMLCSTFPSTPTRSGFLVFRSTRLPYRPNPQTCLSPLSTLLKSSVPTSRGFKSVTNLICTRIIKNDRPDGQRRTTLPSLDKLPTISSLKHLPSLPSNRFSWDPPYVVIDKVSSSPTL